MMTTPINSIGLVLFASVLGSFGAVFLKLGAERLRYGFRHVISWQAFVGVMFYLASSVFFVAGVRRGELSVLYPMVSLGYVWTLIWSKLFFREPFTREKFVALGLILFGICLIGVGAR
jgi:multidrug transporter EmrE-like cation transporter